MNENKAWMIVMCCLILTGGACEIIQSQNRVEQRKIDFEAQKYCYDNGGEARWWGSGCFLEKKK